MKSITAKTRAAAMLLVLFSTVGASRAEKKIERGRTYINGTRSELWQESSGATIDDVVYIAGGTEVRSGLPLNTVVAYDIHADSITPRAPMATPRSKFGLAAVNGRLYAIGGAGAAGSLSSVEEYEPRTNLWRSRASLNVARGSLSVGVVNGIIYAVGGWDGNKYSSVVEAFDPKKNVWSIKAGLPEPVATRDSVAVANGKIYLVGGSNQAAYQRIQIYDPSRDVWSVGPDLPFDINQPIAVEAVDDVLHGFLNNLAAATHLALSLKTGNWVVEAIDAPIGHFATADSSGSIYGPKNGAHDMLAYRPRGDFHRNHVRRDRYANPAKAEAAADHPTSDVDTVNGKKSPRPQDFALIVGIETYRTVLPADFSERDAVSFKNYAVSMLGVPEENAILLLGDRARRADIAKYLEEWLPRNIGPDSRVYFYFSGHGAPDPLKGTSYLVPWDGDPSFLASSGYPIAKLYANLEALKAKEIFVALDACFSGDGGRSVIAKGLRPLVHVVDTPVPTQSKLSVLTAARSDETAGSEENQRHGLFTYYFLKGLKGDADIDGAKPITLSRLHMYIQENVRRAARRQNRDQTPQVYSSSMGLIVR